MYHIIHDWDSKVHSFKTAEEARDYVERCELGNEFHLLSGDLIKSFGESFDFALIGAGPKRKS